MILLIPLALGRILTKGLGSRLITAAKWICIAALLLNLIPFLSQQIQQVLYPQLERVSLHPGRPSPQLARSNTYTGGKTITSGALRTDSMAEQLPASAPMAASDDQALGIAEYAKEARSEGRSSGSGGGGSRGFGSAVLVSKGKSQNASLYQSSLNLQNDINANIQTGPAQPTWKWRSVSFGWNGPVTAAQTVHPILIPLTIERLLAILRIITLLLLAGILLNARRISDQLRSSAGAASVSAVLIAGFMLLGFADRPPLTPRFPTRR